MAITSDAAVMLNPSSRMIPLPLPPTPMMIWRRARSFMSITRFHTTVRGSISSSWFFSWILLSISAAKRLLAFSIAEKSPVKCRLISTIGITWEYPPPAAPPLIPKTGPREGSRKATPAFFPILFNPSHKPIETVVFPSPAGVGLIAVTRIRLLLLTLSSLIRESGSFALYFP